MKEDIYEILEINNDKNQIINDSIEKNSESTNTKSVWPYIIMAIVIVRIVFKLVQLFND